MAGSRGFAFGGNLPHHLRGAGIRPHDVVDEKLGFGNGRDGAEVGHPLGSGVIGGHRQGDVVAEPVQAAAQVTHAAGHVLLRVEGIVHPHEGRGAGHELHQALGPLGGDRPGVEAGFVAHHRPHQGGVHPVKTGIFMDQGLHLRIVPHLVGPGAGYQVL